MNQKLQNTLLWIYFILLSYQHRSGLIIFVSKESIKNIYVEKKFNTMQMQKEIKFENSIYNCTIFQKDFGGVQCVFKCMESPEAVFPISLS